jgi:hypothetical protein
VVRAAGRFGDRKADFLELILGGLFMDLGNLLDLLGNFGFYVNA